MIDITFFVPCYNEAENVTGTLKMIKTLMQGRPHQYEIVVVDDGSSDDTTDVIQSYCRSNPQEPIVTYRNPVNLGLGRNYFLCAKKSRGRYYILINGDNDTSIHDFRVILDQLGKADMIVPYVVNQEERPLFVSALSYSQTDPLSGVLTTHCLSQDALHFFEEGVNHF